MFWQAGLGGVWCVWVWCVRVWQAWYVAVGLGSAGIGLAGKVGQDVVRYVSAGKVSRVMVRLCGVW